MALCGIAIETSRAPRLLGDGIAQLGRLQDLDVRTEERLARGFRRAYGEPLGTYLRRIRVNAAARLLATTDEPISRVAGEVGFADQSHLTRWFGRYLETTPGRYRGSARRDLIKSRRAGPSDLLPPF